MKYLDKQWNINQNSDCNGMSTITINNIIIMTIIIIIITIVKTKNYNNNKHDE